MRWTISSACKFFSFPLKRISFMFNYFVHDALAICGVIKWQRRGSHIVNMTSEDIVVEYYSMDCGADSLVSFVSIHTSFHMHDIWFRRGHFRESTHFGLRLSLRESLVFSRLSVVLFWERNSSRYCANACAARNGHWCVSERLVATNKIAPNFEVV